MTTDIQANHLLPPGPVVTPTVPDTQRMPDVLLPENRRHRFVTGAKSVVATDRKDNIEMAQGGQPLWLVFIRNESARVVKVHVIVGVAPGEASDIVDAAQPDHAVNQVRIAEGKIGGMIRAEARAGRNQKRIGILLLREGQNLVVQVTIILHMPQGALRRMAVFGIPAFAIDTIDTEELEPTLFQMIV